MMGIPCGRGPGSVDQSKSPVEVRAWGVSAQSGLQGVTRAPGSDASRSRAPGHRPHLCFFLESVGLAVPPPAQSSCQRKN